MPSRAQREALWARVMSNTAFLNTNEAVKLQPEAAFQRPYADITSTQLQQCNPRILKYLKSKWNPGLKQAEYKVSGTQTPQIIMAEELPGSGDELAS